MLSEKGARSCGVNDVKDETQVRIVRLREQMAMGRELMLELAAKAAIPSWLIHRILKGESQEDSFLSNADQCGRFEPFPAALFLRAKMRLNPWPDSALTFRLRGL